MMCKIRNIRHSRCGSWKSIFNQALENSQGVDRSLITIIKKEVINDLIYIGRIETALKSPRPLGVLNSLIAIMMRTDKSSVTASC